MDIILYYSNSSYILSYECNPGNNNSDDNNNDDDLDILKSQVFSIISSIEEISGEIILLDYVGRLISSYEALLCAYHEMIRFHSKNNELIGNDLISLPLWCITSSFLTSTCTNNLLTCDNSEDVGKRMALQSQYHMMNTNYRLCQYCMNYLDSSLIDSTPRELVCFSCDSSILHDMGVIVVTEKALASESRFLPIKNTLPTKLFVMRELYKKAILQQDQSFRYLMNSTVGTTTTVSSLFAKRQEFSQILKSGMDVVQVYEDYTQQQCARNIINYEKIIQYMNIYLYQNSTQSQNPSIPPDVAVIHGLMKWFKGDLFQWCNKPQCENPNCVTHPQYKPILSENSESFQRPNHAMNSIGMTSPTEQERIQGWATRVELYECQYCHQKTRFPRYNNPSYLITKSPRGRCGEFANAFGLICRSMGFDVRYVRDLTDHVWIEVWLPSLQRFVHADCCEQALDTPLLYELGWGKKLTYIISFSRYGIVEVSAKYSRNLKDVIIRRQELQYGDQYVMESIESKSQEVKKAFLTHSKYIFKITFSNDKEHSGIFIPERYKEALYFGASEFESMTNQELSQESITKRNFQLNMEIEAMMFLSKEYEKLEELPGRISGSIEWKKQRGELGHHPVEMIGVVVDGTVEDDVENNKFNHKHNNEKTDSFTKGG